MSNFSPVRDPSFGQMALIPAAAGPSANARVAFADALVANAPAVNAGVAPVPANPTMKLSPGGRKTKRRKRIKRRRTRRK